MKAKYYKVIQEYLYIVQYFTSYKYNMSCNPQFEKQNNELELIARHNECELSHVTHKGF